MKQKITAQDILNDIEFEIAQGMLSKQSFGPALEAVRQFQNRLRIQAFKSIKINHPQREIISKQFQTVDMLLVIVQEMALRIQALQNSLENLAPEHADKLSIGQPSKTSLDNERLNPAFDTGFPSGGTPGGAASQTARSPEEVLQAMRPETISVPLQVRPIRWPMLGGLLTRLRILYQRPAVHYTALLSERQAPVNRALGDRILYLEALLQEQNQRIIALEKSLLETRQALSERSKSET